MRNKRLHLLVAKTILQQHMKSISKLQSTAKYLGNMNWEVLQLAKLRKPLLPWNF